MRPLRCCGLLVTCLAVPLLAQPPAAVAGRLQATHRREVTHAGDLAAFRLRGSDGYSLEFLTLGQRLVTLTASKGHVGAVYSTRGRIAGNHIRARFGNLGRISVWFHPSRSPRPGAVRSRRCSANSTVTEAGTFRGIVRFAGERGYTSVDAHHANGIAIRTGRSACETDRNSRTSAALPVGKLTTHLAAVSRQAGRVVSLDVLGFRGARLWVQASTQERHGSMEISRLAYAMVGGPNAFVSSDAGVHPAFAMLKPPKPFSGTGVFQEANDPSPRWTGSLSAWLPGAGKVSLAGPDFASSYCRRAPDDGGCSLFPPVRRLRLAQDRGSQSQARGDTRLSWSR